MAQNVIVRLGILFLIICLLWLKFSSAIVGFLTSDSSVSIVGSNYNSAFIVVIVLLFIAVLIKREIKVNSQLESLHDEHKALGDELKISHKSLIQGEQKYRLFFENINDGALMLEYSNDIAEGVIVEANKTLASQLGYSVEQIINQKIISLFIKGESVLNEIQTKIEESSAFKIRSHMRKKSGKEVPFEISFYKSDSADKYMLYAIARNIEKRTNYINKIMQAKDEAERANKLKEIFLANMSHEVRTPLNGIIGFTDLIGVKKFDEEKLKKFIGTIRSSSLKLLQVITDIMELSRIESDQMTLQEYDFLLPEVLDRIKAYLHSEIEKSEKPIEGHFIDQSQKLSIISTDQHKIYRIATILISNAIKFTHKGSIQFKCRVHEQNLVFEISDTGIGIPVESIDAIFDNFNQGDGSFTRQFEGNGVGLSIVRGLIRLLGGSIHVYSTPNEGTRFVYNIPYTS